MSLLGSNTMNIMKLFVSFLISHRVMCSLRINQSSNLDDMSIITQTIIKICELCFAKNSKEIAFIGDRDYSFHDSKLASIILLNNNSPTISIEGNDKLVQKPQVYVITARSPIEFNKTLQHLKRSQWWHHSALYLIIDKTTHDGSCGNEISELLWISWRMNLISVIVLCIYNSIPMLYTANPFTNRAPKPWGVVKNNNYYNQGWTLYRQRYQASICDTLNYDKTLNLDGYVLRALVALNGIEKSIKIHLNYNDTGWATLGGVDGTTMHHVFRRMNASLDILPYKLSETYYRGDKVPTEVLWSVNKGKYDIDLHSWYRTTVGLNASTYPLWQRGPRLMTQRKSSLTTWEKFLLFFEPWIVISLITISICSLIILKFYWKQNISSAALEVLRMIVNTAVMKIPDTQSGRIYFLVILNYYMVINGLFQGELEAILTKPVLRRQVNNLNDLKLYRHKVRGYKTYIRYLDTSTDDLFIGQETFDCDMSVIEDKNTACIREGMDLMQFAHDHDLHLSEDIIVNQYNVFAVAENWPLLDRVDNSLMALFETGLIDFWYKNTTEKLLENMNKHKVEASITKFDVIQLSSLMFAFNALSIGLSVAAICFIVELKCQRVLHQLTYQMKISLFR